MVADLVPLVIGILASPFPVIPVILLLLTPRATANAVSYTGAKPHFVDSENRSMGIDAAKLDLHLGTFRGKEPRKGSRNDAAVEAKKRVRFPGIESVMKNTGNCRLRKPWANVSPMRAMPSSCSGVSSPARVRTSLMMASPRRLSSSGEQLVRR